MKATIKTEDGKELEIELSCEQEQQIKELCKNEFDIDYKGKGYLLNSDGVARNSNCTYVPFFRPGKYRKTKEHCEEAIKLNQQVNRLDELVKWLDPYWKEDWKDDNQQKYYLYYSYGNNNKFYMDVYNTVKTIGAVHMSEYTANKICDALNTGKLPELFEILKG